jgi:hypothetical protein
MSELEAGKAWGDKAVRQLDALVADREPAIGVIQNGYALADRRLGLLRSAPKMKITLSYCSVSACERVRSSFQATSLSRIEERDISIGEAGDVSTHKCRIIYIMENCQRNAAFGALATPPAAAGLRPSRLISKNSCGAALLDNQLHVSTRTPRGPVPGRRTSILCYAWMRANFFCCT